MSMANPLEYAIQLERDGQEFYTEAAATTANPLGRRMFESLAADERRHEEVLRGVAQRLDVELGADLPKQRLVSLFSELGPQMKQELGADPGDSKIIAKAIDMEKASVALYAGQAEAAGAAKDKALYERLVQEESQHIDILQNTLTYLDNTGQWFLWDEQAVLDGG